MGNYLEQWLSCGERGLLGLPPGEASCSIAMRILLGCESQVASGRRRAAAGRGLRGNDPQSLLVAHRRALQRTVPGKGVLVGSGARAPGARDPDVCSPRCASALRPEGARPHPRAHRGEHSRQDPQAAGGGGGRGCKDALQLLIEHCGREERGWTCR